MSLTNVQQRFNKYETELQELLNNDVLSIDEDDNLAINFLDEQMSEFTEISKKRSDAGRASAEKRKGNKCSTSVKQVSNNKEKIREDKDKDKKNIPAFSEFETFALSKKTDINKEALKLKYDAWVENGWKDGNNKPIKNWKAKLLNTIPYLKNDERNKSNPKQINDGWDRDKEGGLRS